MKTMKCGMFLVVFLFGFFSLKERVMAEDYTEKILKQLDLEPVDKQTEELPEKLTFSRLADALMEKGTDGLDGKMICEYVSDVFFYELGSAQKIFVEIVSISVLFAIFGKVLVTGQKYVSELGFFIVYTGIMLLLLESFSLIGQVVEDGVGKVVSFMTAFVPTYAATLLISGNGTSASGFYQVAFGLIYLLELAMKFLFLPGVHILILLFVMDHMFEESRLSKIALLLEDGMKLLLKISLAAVVGFGVVQSLIAPAKDRLATSGVYHSLEAIPGIGNTIGATGEILVGCAMMIKNSLGVSALIILVVICFVPLLKVFGFYVMYRLTAAVLWPFCDRRIAQCVHDVSRGCAIYLKVLLDVVLLFFITISMISASTSFIY